MRNRLPRARQSGTHCLRYRPARSRSGSSRRAEPRSPVDSGSGHPGDDGGMARTTLAVALHDPDGRTVAALDRLGDALRGCFPFVALNATMETHVSVLDAFSAGLGAEVITHDPDERLIGQARRNAVELALSLGGDQILYSDGDHLLRWIESRPDEVRAALDAPVADLLVVGRSPGALAAAPQRLRDTEAVVNHIYRLMRPGRAWDLMFAVRRLTPEAAAVVVDSCREQTIASDVTWPLLVERHGLTVDYVAADGLSYRTIHDFGGVRTITTAIPWNGSDGSRSQAITSPRCASSCERCPDRCPSVISWDRRPGRRARPGAGCGRGPPGRPALRRRPHAAATPRR